MLPARLGIQGAGHLAAALIEGFCRSQTIPISLQNRTPERALALARAFPAVRVLEEDAFDAEECPLLFVIPGPALLDGMGGRLERVRGSGRVAVSCAGGLSLPVLEKRFPGIPWLRAIPSVTAAVGAGVTLVARGASATEEQLRTVKRLFEGLGQVMEVSSDEEMDRLAVVTSCLPGLLAATLDELAAVYGLDENQTRELLIESAAAFLALAKRATGDLAGLVASVARPGGMTEAGVSVIRSKLPAVWAELKAAMDQRQEQRRAKYLAC
jgi:pyrroline-5-carboxylate reductase